MGIRYPQRAESTTVQRWTTAHSVAAWQVRGSSNHGTCADIWKYSRYRLESENEYPPLIVSARFESKNLRL